MKMLAFFFAVAHATPSLHGRAVDIDKVKTDVANIDINVRQLNSVAIAYNGGFLGVAPLTASLSGVFAALEEGVHDSDRLPPTISIENAASLVIYVNQTLAINNPIAVQTFISKKTLFKNSPVGSFIAPALEHLLAGHESFSDHILTRIPDDAPAELVEQGKAVVEVISNALRKGIREFQE